MKGIKPPQSLHEFIERLRACGEIQEISTPVNTSLELASIHRLFVEQKGPALLFTHPIGSKFPVVSNLFGSEKRLLMAVGEDIEERLYQILRLLQSQGLPSFKSLWKHRKALFLFTKMGTKKVAKAPLFDNVQTADLSQIPFIQCYPDDGGKFLTLPLVYTEDPQTSAPNLGIYRIQRFSNQVAGLHWQIGKGGAYHYHVAEKANKALPVTIYLGGPPALILSAITPLPENMSELILASIFLNAKLSQTRIDNLHHAAIGQCDLALFGYALPKERHVEGPFGDHYGYQDPTCEFPVFHAERMAFRKNAIIPATVVGKPFQEDAYIGLFLQKLLLPFLKFQIPNLHDLYTYPETGFHPLCSAYVSERYEKESLTTALRLLGEGQIALTKVLFIINNPIPLPDIQAVIAHLVSHMREDDIYIIPSSSSDSLDPTAPSRNRGSKVIFLGRSDKPFQVPHTSPSLPAPIRHGIVFVPGCLVIDSPNYEELPDPHLILGSSHLRQWPLILLVDNAERCCSSNTNFLWEAFTRFNPSNDMYCRKKETIRPFCNFSFPLLIDARSKPHYQKPLIPDPQIEKQVQERFHVHFH
jgi:4-hydroxybenzoate decarboxylase subunit C